MTGAYQVQWIADDSRAVTSPEEVVELIRELHAKAKDSDALLVAVTSPCGDDLTIGVGRDTSVCGWMDATKEPPYFGSRGPSEDGPDLVFFYLGAWTDFPAVYGIPVDEAIGAVREFVACGQRPTTIQWQEI